MKEISKSLSDVIINTSQKLIHDAKFDKTYKCRVISKVSDDKYVVMKDNVEHTVSSAFSYNVNDIVTVLLPENSWKDALIVYPQNNLNTVTQLNTISNNISTLSNRVTVSETSINIIDTRNENNAPEWYMENYALKMIIEFKMLNSIGLATTSVHTPLITITPWHDISGGYPRQIAWNGTVMYHRVGVSITEWGNWISLN